MEIARTGLAELEAVEIPFVLVEIEEARSFAARKR